MIEYRKKGLFPFMKRIHELTITKDLALLGGLEIDDIGVQLEEKKYFLNFF